VYFSVCFSRQNAKKIFDMPNEQQASLSGVAPHTGKPKGKNAIITFNYDTLIEEALQNLRP
jgi:hypothetical protein